MTSRRRFHRYALGLAAALTLVYGDASWGLEAPGRLAYYASPTRAWELLTGALLALHWPRLARIGPRPAALLGAVGLATVLVELTVVQAFTTDAAPVPVVAVAGTALILVGGAHRGPVTRILSTRPVTTLGDWSYAWYLWHWPAIVIARIHAPDQRWVAVVAAACLVWLVAWTARPKRGGTR